MSYRSLRRYSHQLSQQPAVNSQKSSVVSPSSEAAEHVPVLPVLSGQGRLSYALSCDIRHDQRFGEARRIVVD